MFSRLLALDPRRRILVYLAITLIVYGAMILLDGVVVEDIFEEGVAHADIDVYRDRTQTILDGGWLYSDVHTETPPIINYLLVPAQLLGGSENDLVYSAYFSAFAFIGASLLYLGLRRWDDDLSYLAGLLFLISPFIVVESTFGVEDESIVILTFIIPLLLMIRHRNNGSTAAIAVGMWTKMFSVLLYPIILLRSDWKGKGRQMIILSAITLAITGPFLLCCWDDFSWFLDFYFLGVDGRNTGGSSLWHFLDMGGWGLPGQASIVLTAGSLLFAYFFTYRRGMDVWRSALIIMVAFFIFYPKIHTGYWLMPLVLLLPWAAEYRDIAIRIFLIYVPVIAATAFAVGDAASPIIDEPWGWVAGAALALLASVLLVEMSRKVIVRECFLDQGEGI